MKKVLLITFILSCFIAIHSVVNSQTKVESDSLYLFTDEMPQFPGGDSARLMFIYNNLSYPLEAYNMNIQGNVFLNVKIEKDGRISDVSIVKSDHFFLEYSAMNLIRIMPNWIPAKIDGKYVRSQVAIKIPFFITKNTSPERMVFYEGSNDTIFSNPDFQAHSTIDETFLFKKLEEKLMMFDTIRFLEYQSIKILFVVEKDGAITNVNVFPRFDSIIHNEIVNFCKYMSEWTPATNNLKNVRSIKKAYIEVGDNSKLEDEIFFFVEQEPSFPGGNYAMNKFFHENLVYPEFAKESMPPLQGIVYTSFVVEKDGSLSNIKILRGIGGGCDEEVIRLFKLMPKWIPGKQRGKVVRSQFSFPVRFTLSN